VNLYLNAAQQAAMMRDLAAADYLSAVRTARIVHPDWREGQAHINTLALLHPDVADELANRPELDPLHDDTRLPDYLAFVRPRLQI
jgi:hypothetical protein